MPQTPISNPTLHPPRKQVCPIKRDKAEDQILTRRSDGSHSDSADLPESFKINPIREDHRSERLRNRLPAQCQPIE
jgi:hypothetical protein